MTGKTTFYAWTEQGPSNLLIGISGGPTKDAVTGLFRVLPFKSVQFRKGTVSTDDAETIAKLRELALQGEQITEDRAVYLSHVETPQKRVDREAQELLASRNEEIKRLNEELLKDSKAHR